MSRAYWREFAARQQTPQTAALADPPELDTPAAAESPKAGPWKSPVPAPPIRPAGPPSLVPAACQARDAAIEDHIFRILTDAAQKGQPAPTVSQMARSLRRGNATICETIRRMEHQGRIRRLRPRNGGCHSYEIPSLGLATARPLPRSTIVPVERIRDGLRVKVYPPRIAGDALLGRGKTGLGVARRKVR